MKKGNDKIMKKTIDMVAIQPHKANAQALVCFISFIASTSMAAIITIVACFLPVVCTPTAVVCWISMILEAISICLGGAAWWIKVNAM